MSKNEKQIQELVGPEESVRMMDSLRRGASRRDVLAMLAAGGMQATLAGSIATLATRSTRRRRKRVVASRWPAWPRA